MKSNRHLLQQARFLHHLGP